MLFCVLSVVDVKANLDIKQIKKIGNNVKIDVRCQVFSYNLILPGMRLTLVCSVGVTAFGWLDILPVILRLNR